MADAAERNVFTVVVFVYIRFSGTSTVNHDTSSESVTVNQENCKLISKVTVAEAVFLFFHSFLSRVIVMSQSYCYEPLGGKFVVFHCGHTLSGYALYWWCTRL